MSKLEKEVWEIEKSTRWSNINLTALEDPNISPIAKFIHTYLMSRPPGWIIRTKDIINRSTAGRDAIYKGLKELRETGYIHRWIIRGDNGRMGGYKYKVNINPSPFPEKPETVTPETVKPHTYYYNSSSIDQLKTFSKEKDGPDSSGLTEKRFALRIKPRKPKTNNNGLLYNSLAVPKGSVDLSKWLNRHNINKYDDREKDIHEFQTELLDRKISPADIQIKEVLDYWNKIASEMRNNGHKLPVHQVKDTKTIYMCQLIITGILHTSGHTAEDLKKAIDNYSWILENSPWYNKIYPFPKFFSNKKLFDDCITNNVKENNRYVNSKRKPSKGGLLEGVKRLHKKTHGREPSSEDVKMYRYWIKEGDIKTENDFAGYVN